MKARRSWKKLEDDKTREKMEEAATKLGTQLGHPQLGDRADIDNYADLLIEGPKAVAEGNLPLTRRSRISVSFWSGECNAAVTRARKARKEHTRSRCREKESSHDTTRVKLAF